MLRNPSRMRPIANVRHEILNEVLSLNAQEFG